MAFAQRLLTLVLVPLLAFLTLRTYSPQTIDDLQNAASIQDAYQSLTKIFSKPLPARSDTPLIISSMAHWSHFEKNAAIAVALAERGYPITFLTGRAFEKQASTLHPNITFVPFQGPDDKMSEEDLKTWLALPPGIDRELFAMKKATMDSMADTHRTLQHHFSAFREKYGGERPLISLYDYIVMGHQPVLLGAPGIRPDVSIGIGLGPLALDSQDTFPFPMGKPPHEGPDAKEVHRLAYEKMNENRFERELNEYYREKLAEVGAKRDTYARLWHAIGALPDYLMNLGIPEFQFPRGDLRPNVRFFGAFDKVGKMAGTEGQLPEWWWDVAEAKTSGKKIVAVSQGTVEMRPQELVLPTLEALKGRDDVLVVATFVVSEPEEVEGLVVPENARVAKFVPYDVLLPMVDVLVSNAGLGALQHSLRLGIPMVVAGEGQDKAENAAIVEYTGVGINLRTRAPAAEKIRDAVVKVLEDDSFRSKAEALSKNYERYDVGREFDQVIQDALRKL